MVSDDTSGARRALRHQATVALVTLVLAAANLGPAFANGKDLQARYNMSLASLLAGITLNMGPMPLNPSRARVIRPDNLIDIGLSLVIVKP